MKKHHLLIPLIFALALTACAADGGKETAVSAVENAPEKAPSQPATSAAPRDVTNLTEPVTSSPPAGAPATAVLPLIAPAPAWDNEVWINSETPLPLADLRGKVVLLEFWTFG